MSRRILLDTGPLVASVNRRDRFHEWALERFDEITQPLLTCEAVLAEACFLLRSTPGGGVAVLDFLGRGALLIEFSAAAHAASLGAMMKKYADVPMSLADACLVRMTELQEDAVVMTLDRDFLVYRRHGRQTVPVLMPPGSAAR